MTKHSTHLAVLGAGPAGYVAAFLAADQGLDVTLIDERGALGGTCLHEGCIPSKALLHIADIINTSEQASQYGVIFNQPRLDIEKIQTFRREIIKKLSSGLTQLCKLRKITFIQAAATLIDPQTLCLSLPDHKKQNLSFEKCILATGSRPRTLPSLDICDNDIITSQQALELSTIPARILVVGAGYIGLEMATIFATLGSRVTLCEITAAILPGIDRDLASVVEKTIRKKMAILCSAKIDSVQRTSAGLEVVFKDLLGETTTEPFDKILIAAGRMPNSENLGLEKTQIKTDAHGFIQTNPFGQTTEKNIYAIGDVRGGLQLAHKASAEAQAVVQTLTHKKTRLPASEQVPCAVYTNPEIAFCGLSEEQAKKQSKQIQVIKIPWKSSGRALAMGQGEGLTKLIFDASAKKLLGVAMVGMQASELIGPMNLAITLNADANDLAQNIFPHPSLSEMFREGAESLLGRNPHTIKK